MALDDRTVKGIRDKSRSAKAATVSSYSKGGYKYTESSPGSNRFQNFSATKPVEKAKAAVPTPRPRPTATAKPSLANGYSPRDRLPMPSVSNDPKAAVTRPVAPRSSVPLPKPRPTSKATVNVPLPRPRPVAATPEAAPTPRSGVPLPKPRPISPTVPASAPKLNPNRFPSFSFTDGGMSLKQPRGAYNETASQGKVFDKNGKAKIYYGTSRKSPPTLPHKKSWKIRKGAFGLPEFTYE